jgi:hypothetical protein
MAELFAKPAKHATTMPELTEDLWNKLWKAQQEREAKYLEELKAAIAASEPPLPGELTEAVLRLSASDAREALKQHRGYLLAERRDSYLTSLAIMESCLQDLLASIRNFEAEATADNSQLFSRLQESKLRDIERHIQKELFATANAAASLVDHSRRVQSLKSMSAYDAQRLASFGTDGLHEFVIALRVILHHLHMMEAGWNLQTQFAGGPKTATFTINKAKVQEVIADSGTSFSKASLKAIEAYIATAPENMDLRAIFLDYRARIDKFHEWMQKEVSSAPHLRDYDRVVQDKKNFDQRLFWKAMIGNWLNWKPPPNPHAHLARYLTPEQLEEVYKLPRNSKTQVDLVISYMDRDYAIDDELRQQAYKLFEASPAL